MSDEALLPTLLMREIISYVERSPNRYVAFCALIGAAVGAADGHMTNRAMAETLWMLGDRTAERRNG